MTVFRIFRFSLSLIFAAPLAGAIAYDSPRLENSVIDVDALFLKSNDRETTVEALAAVASNFPKSELIDEDLREKALALALNLNPLNVNARRAHKALLAGRKPDKTEYYDESVSGVAERLWTLAARMIGGEPEARKLALYLMELSLTLHPDPPLKRVNFYGQLTGFSAQPWSKIVSMQAQSSPSNRKLAYLYRVARSRPEKKEIRPGRNGMKGRPITKGQMFRPNSPPTSPPTTMNRNASEIKIKEAEIPFIARTVGSVRTSNQPGTVSMLIRPAEPEEAGLFKVGENRPMRSATQMRLLSDPDAFRPEALNVTERLIRKAYPVWPNQMVAEISFDSQFPSRSPRRLTRANISLPAGLLLESAFTGRQLRDDLVYSGLIDITSGEMPFLTVGDNVAEVLEGAKQMEAEVLLLPDTHYQAMLDGAVKTRRLDYLFNPQIISYSGWEQLKKTAFGEDADALEGAMDAFEEIEAVQDKMSLTELAKNEKVQERLKAIVEGYPQHLSARVMLEFGKTPDDPKALVRESVRDIEDAIKPFVVLVKQIANSVDPDDIDFDEAKEEIEGADLALSRLRRTVHQDSKTYLAKAEDFLKAAEVFLNATNKNTSLGEQRFREFGQAFQDLRTARIALGLD